jgi:RHS repeat-associated protein
MRHDAWGVVLDDSVSSLIPFGFAGGLYDAETGLVRFGARDYEPSVGRWVSKDPIRFGGGKNLYQYASGNPVKYVDRTGRATTMPAPVPVPWGPIFGGGFAGAVVAGIPGAIIGAILGAAVTSVPGDTPIDDDGCGPKDRPWPPDAPPPAKRDCYKHAANVYEGCVEDLQRDPDTCTEVANYALLKCLAESGGN